MSGPTLDMSKVKITMGGRTLTNLQNVTPVNEGDDAITFGAVDLYGNQSKKIRPKKMKHFDVEVTSGSDDEMFLEDLYETKSKQGKGVAFSYLDERNAIKARGGSGTESFVTTPTTGSATDDNVTFRVVISEYIPRS